MTEHFKEQPRTPSLMNIDGQFELWLEHSSTGRQQCPCRPTKVKLIAWTNRKTSNSSIGLDVDNVSLQEGIAPFIDHIHAEEARILEHVHDGTIRWDDTKDSLHSTTFCMLLECADAQDNLVCIRFIHGREEKSRPGSSLSSSLQATSTGRIC